MNEDKLKNNQTKVVVIGLDGATFDIIDPLTKKGKLPNLHYLIQRGVRGILESTMPPLSPVAWTSFMTGTNPGKHGIFDFFGLRRGSYHFQVNNSTLRKAESLWSIISRNGKKVGIMNIPVTYPVEKVNGFMISGLGTPSTKSTFTYPEDLHQEILSKIGSYILNPDYITNSDPSNPRYISEMSNTMDNHLDTVKYLMKTKDWDLFIYVITATDEIQHDCWKCMDQNHHSYNEQLNKKYGDFIFRIYEKADKAVGEIMDLSGSNTTFIIMSDHGHGPLHKFFFLNNWLMREGYFCFTPGYQKNMKYQVINLFKKLSDKCLLPLGMYANNQSIQKLIARCRGTIIGISSSYHINNIDWGKTTAFCEGSFPAIYINSEGKFPKGIVKAGEEYDILRNQIINKLLYLDDPHTGKRVVKTIFRPEEIYHGEYIKNAPDLICVLNNGYHGGGELEQLYFGHQSNDLFGNHRWSSQHNMEGIFIAAGPNISSNKIIANAQIIDLAPTILHLLGLPISQNMDGKVLEDIFENSYLSTHKKKFTDKKDVENIHRDEQILPDNDSELVKNRLRELGYIE